jgi:hypothetical protein
MSAYVKNSLVGSPITTTDGCTASAANNYGFMIYLIIFSAVCAIRITASMRELPKHTTFHMKVFLLPSALDSDQMKLAHGRITNQSRIEHEKRSDFSCIILL